LQSLIWTETFNIKNALSARQDREMILKYMGRDYLNHWKGLQYDEAM